jgi:hypothetical protein
MHPACNPSYKASLPSFGVAHPFIMAINSMSPSDSQKRFVTSWYGILIGNRLIDIVHSVQHIILLDISIIRSYTGF